jgi:hypothetical protein
MYQPQADFAMYWAPIMQTQSTCILLAWTQLRWSESAAPTGENHRFSALEETTLFNTAHGQIVAPPRTKLINIDRECIIYFCLAEVGWTMESTFEKAGQGKHLTSQSRSRIDH